MSEFENKDECCVLDSGISNITALHDARSPVLHFAYYLSFPLTSLLQREDVIATVQSSLDAS